MLEVSSWDSNANNLKEFLTYISYYDEDGHKAIELAF
jgi:hypothetical protein